MHKKYNNIYLLNQHDISLLRNIRAKLIFLTKSTKVDVSLEPDS